MRQDTENDETRGVWESTEELHLRRPEVYVKRRKTVSDL